MCTGIEPVVLASIIGGASTAASALLAPDAPKIPAPRPTQPQRQPNVNAAWRRRATQGLSASDVPSTALTAPATARSTLLGQ